MEVDQNPSDSDHDGYRATKRARHSPPPNGNGHAPERNMPPLSLSILGVEPLDEFIREVADFVHHMIVTRADRTGVIEVEAKIGVLRDRTNGQRLQLPVLVETSTHSYVFGCKI